MSFFNDIKLYALNTTVFAISLSNIDMVLKLTLLSISIGYTVQKWYYLNKNKKQVAKLDKSKMTCNKPRRTPSHPTKSHVVKACEGGKEKIIRFGQQGVTTAGKPKKGESAKQKARRASFKARHAKNIKKGKMSAAWWADKVKW